MYWVSEILDANTDPKIIIKYYHINIDTKIIEIHTKVSKNQQEFDEYYKKIKCL